MLFAKVTFVAGFGMFLAAAVGAAGTWALSVSTVMMGLAGLVAVVVMEERDYIGVPGRYPGASDPLPDLVVVPTDEDGLAPAA